MLARYVYEIMAAKIDITLSDDMWLDLWKKFALLSGTSGATASTRQPLGVIRDDPDMHTLLRRLMHETVTVGRAAGVPFDGRPSRPSSTASIAGFPPTMRASMANDLEAGNRLELDWLAGKVVALGRKYSHRDAHPGGGLRHPQAVPDGPAEIAAGALPIRQFELPSAVG